MSTKYQITYSNHNDLKEALIDELQWRLSCVVKSYRFNTHRYIEVELYLNSDMVNNGHHPLILITRIEVGKRLVKAYLIPENFTCFKRFFDIDYHLRIKECRNCEGSGMEPIEKWDL